MKKLMPLKIEKDHHNTISESKTTNLHIVKNSEDNCDSEMKVFVTTDEDLLRQYYDLRHKAYNEENGWEGFDGSENEFDRNGKIGVAVKEGKVVGGVRVMFSDQCNYFSNEIPGTQYEYSKVIRKYDERDNLIIGDIAGFVVHKDYRDRATAKKLLQLCLEESVKYGCHYMFAVAISMVCRNYRIIYRSLGYYVEIVINYPWKEKEVYHFSKTFPMYIKLN